MAGQIKDVNVQSRYEESMVKYSIEVNRLRSIPNAYDSLKPVQRRDIYSLFEMHGIPGNKRIKSAGVVGDVMKKYHPHGDCLDGDTVIKSAVGDTYTIRELYESDIKSISIVARTENGNYIVCEATDFRIGQYTKNKFNITLSDGFVLKCTGNHPIMKANGKFEQARDLNKGDKLFCSDGYHNREPLTIASIYVEAVEDEPMYDFTVMGFENMLIPSNNGNYICVHNSSIYGALWPMAQPYNSKMPILDPQGNWGSVMGDDPAAMRYTEVRLSEFGYDCVIGELKESNNVVDWVDNFDRTLKEPEYLPVKVPLLLINGSFGLGVGMMTTTSTHNLSEVIDQTRALLHNPNHQVVLIPDHCQACEIIDTDWEEISRTGNGSYKVRGVVKVGQYNKDTALFITSLPNGVTADSVVSKIYDLIESKQLPMIKKIDNNSDNVVNIVIVLKPGSDPNYVKQVLYVRTDIQKTCNINFEVVIGKGTKRVSYNEYLSIYLRSRALAKYRMYAAKSQEAMTRYHRLTAYIKVMESGEIDNIVKMVRKQKNIDDEYLTEFLIKKVGITDLQAKFILGTDIRRLSAGYLGKYKEEAKDLEDKMKLYERAITDDGSIITKEIDDELIAIKAKYGTPRLCKVIKQSDSDDIPRGIFRVVITERNFVRKLPDSDSVGIVKKDTPKFVLRVDNTESLLLFDSKGKVYKLPVHKIPVTERGFAGVDIRRLVRNLTADIISVFYEPAIKNIAKCARKHFLTVVTKMNFIKRLELEDFLTVNPSGLIYSKVLDGDEVVDVVISPIDLDIVVYSEHKALRVSTDKIPLFKRNASGSKAMNSNDPIGGASVIYPDAQYIIVVTKDGNINKFSSAGLSSSSRAKAGVSVIKLSKGDSIFSIYGVNDSDILRVVTSEDVIQIPVSEIKLFSSVAKGTPMINTKTTNIIRTDVLKNV